MELKQKGEKADIGAFKQLKVSLIWTSAVDLDLMSFYKTKDGKVGGVYSDNYAGGSLGDLNQFPFIQLSGDEGVGAVGGDNKEELRIARLDDYEELYICAINFTDAMAGSSKVFADYDARIEVATDMGEKHTVILDSKQNGTVALICKLTSGLITNSLVNDSEVMSFDKFKSSIPGAPELQLASKVTLKSKGDTFALKQKVSGGEILINLNWNQKPQQTEKKGFLSKMLSSGGEAIDLDLGCFYEMANGDKACIQPLNEGFLKQGAFNDPPFVYHMGDDRTGSWSEGENIQINMAHLSDLRKVLIFTFIYEGVPDWSNTDAIVTITVPQQPTLEVPMGVQSDARGFCAIAMVEFIGSEIKVTKLVSFHNGHQDCDQTYGWGLSWVAGSKD